MKKKVIVIFAILALLFTSVKAKTLPCFAWYTVPSENEIQPSCFEAKDIVDKYGSIYLGNSQNRRIYLTFDAGYENGNVEKVVDALDRQKVKGAFFVLPHFIRSNPELIKKMTENGHLICNHSTSHKDMSKITDFESFKKEITEIEEIYRSQTGIDMAKYFRFPEGKFSENTLMYAQELGYKTVFWSLAYADWDNNNQPNPEKAKKLLLSRVHNGCVMLLHPTSSTNAEIVEDLIVELKDRGYEFGTLDEFE